MAKAVIDFEKKVLGCLLTDSSSMAEIRRLVNPKMFTKTNAKLAEIAWLKAPDDELEVHLWANEARKDLDYVSSFVVGVKIKSAKEYAEEMRKAYIKREDIEIQNS